MSSKSVGSVKWFNTEKGYGFINGSDGDVFVHYRSISPGENGFKNLDEGDEVEFTQVKSEKGWLAVDVYITRRAIADPEPA